MFASRIPVNQLTGLRPSHWICVGAGFSREDVKAVLLSQGRGFVSDAVTNLDDVALKVAQAARFASGEAEPRPAQPVLKSLARQEGLRLLLADRRVIARVPELKRLRRQGGFFRRLDHAMQMGRMAFSHPEEGAVLDERLEQAFGPSPVRRELQALSAYYESWLENLGVWDPPMLLREAAARLREGWPAGLLKPEAIHHFSGQVPESLERELWDALERHVEIVRIGPLERAVHGATGSCAGEASPGSVPQLIWERWHTIDDAADALAGVLARCDDWSDDVVLIPDSPAVRRSLRRALASRGVPLADPRDPTRLRWDEGLKWALLPLEVVGRGFERPKVVAWLRAYQMQEELPRWVAEINGRGIRQGLQAYSGGKLAGIHSRLLELEDRLGGRRTCAELAEGHLELLRVHCASRADRAWITEFFERLWKDFVSDMERVEQGSRRAPLLYWLERLQARLAEADAPVEKIKPERGLAVYRLHQAPLRPFQRIWILGMPPDWLGGGSSGDYWFTEREREILASEFAVRSAAQLRRERGAALECWLAGASGAHVLDAQYDEDGRERESVGAALAELRLRIGCSAPEEPLERGAHPRWLASYGALRPLQPREARLEPLALRPGTAVPEITATALDRYSRCGMMALAQSRWRLWDSREPDTELWPDVRGNLLHRAVQLIMESRDGAGESRDGEGRFRLAPADALEQAWKLEPPKGLLRGERVARYVRQRLLRVLEAFCEKEREYASRAGTRAISLEEGDFRLEFQELAVVGTPDRIDEHPDGLFVMDYKTSSASPPNGTEMLELGYRLQLPFYALAAEAKLGKPVLGVQFIELNKKAGRGSGIFFAPHNGKEPGKLTQLRSNSKSLLSIERTEAWAQLRESIHAHGLGYASGRFEARPKKKEQECVACAAADFCGFRRLIPETEAESD